VNTSLAIEVILLLENPLKFFFGDNPVTLVTIIHQPDGILKCIVDSRISSEDNVLTDFGPKILPLEYKVLSSTENPHFNPSILDEHTIGFSYCGSTLSALSTYSWVNSSMSQLWQIDRDKPLSHISISDIGKHVATAATTIVSEMAGRKSGTLTSKAEDTYFEAFVFGHCKVENQFVVQHVAPSHEGGYLQYMSNLTDISVQKNGFASVIAIGQQLAVEKYFKIVQELSKTPDQAIAEIVKDPRYGGVGGSCQAAIVTSARFWLTANINLESQEQSLSFLGTEITNMTIGNFKTFGIALNLE